MDSRYNNLLNAYNSLEAAYKRLENSWAYRIGKLVVSPAVFVFERYRLFRDTVTVKKSGLFDSEWYLQTYDDVKKAGMDPVAHYIQFGWKEGRNPSENFDTVEYLSRRPDVAAAGVCPFVYFIKFGSREDMPEKKADEPSDNALKLKSDIAKKNAYCEPALNEEAEFIFEKLMFFSEAR